MPLNRQEKRKKNNPERESHVEIINYKDWHPTVDNKLWKRLEIPGFPTNGSFKNQISFNRKLLYNPRGERIISHYDRLNFWMYQLGSSFVIEHFLANKRPNISKVLEVGCWPMKNEIVDTQFQNTTTALLSQNSHLNVVGVDNVDLETAFPYSSYTPPHFGNGTFINGDINKSKDNQQIIKELKGKPELIVGNMVFETGLGNWAKREQAKKSPTRASILKQFTGLKQDDENRPDNISEEIAISSNNLLATNGVLVICNKGVGETPPFIKQMPLLAIYLDQEGKVYAEVRSKLE